MTEKSTERQAVWMTIAVASLILGGCSWISQTDVIHESPGSTVSLEAVPVRGSTAMYRSPTHVFHASHPILLDPAVLERVLRGVQIGDRPSAASPAKTGQAFSDEEIATLAPYLSTALSRATPDQQVRFRTVPPAAIGSGATEGALYVEGPLLHLTLTDYRQADLDKLTVSFRPESARHPEAERTHMGIFGGTDAAGVAIDYGLLAKRPVSPSEPAPKTEEPATAGRTSFLPLPPARPPQPPPETASTPEGLRALKEHALKKDMENEALKETIQSLQRKLADYEAELNQLKTQKNTQSPSQGRP
jgi:hypothetical protein